MMKKLCMAVALLITSNLAQAELINGSTLDFTPIASGGSSDSLPVDGSGSWAAMEVQPGVFSIIPITSLNGLVLGTTQLASPVPPLGNIDEQWNFFGNLGAHQTVSDSNVLTSTGDTATIDFGGWSVTWNGILGIDMSTGAWNGNTEGVADISCSSGSGCGNGASYILDYSSTVPLGDPSGFGGVHYVLHLEGSISAVPVPAAVWLFGSGLIGLIGVVRRKQKS